MHTLRRVLTILKVVVAQIDVLETMTPRQFTSFRDPARRRRAASSPAQFRELEAVLGRRDNARCSSHYAKDCAANERIDAAMSRPSVFDSFLRYLADAGYDVPAAQPEP